ncbi:ATP-binding protein, partial [Coprococcus eutactus]|nr:ATP-binding protein [Coprococcus eutactus]
YETEYEKTAFEAYIEDNKDKIAECIAVKDKYSYILATNELDTKVCKIRLISGLALNDELYKWRNRCITN